MRLAALIGGAAIAASLTTLPVCAAPRDALTVALPTFGEETFLPWLGSVSRSFYMNMIYQFLVYTDPETLELKPGLAQRWAVSDDGKALTFWLRPGVQFQKGLGEVTSADVKYSIERCIDPASHAGPAGLMRTQIESIETPEPYRVVIRLKSPDIDFIKSYFSDSGGTIVIVSKRYLEEKGDDAANAAPIGTGPFVLSDYRRRSVILLVVRDNSDPQRPPPAFKTVTFKELPEEATRVGALLAGEVDLAPIAYDSIEAVKAAGRQVISIKNAWSPLIRFGGLAKFPNGNTPWSNRKVRQALNYAVDKDAIAGAIFHGEATVTGMNTPQAAFADIAPFPYDPAKARALLAQAGYPNGFEVTMETFPLNPGAVLPSVGDAVTLYWQAVGVKTHVVPTDYGTNRANWISGKTGDIVWTHKGSFNTSPVWQLQISHSTNSLLSTFANDETDQMLRAINGELDPVRRLSLIHAMGVYLHDQASDVFIASVNEVYGASPRIKSWPNLPGMITNIDQIEVQR